MTSNLPIDWMEIFGISGIRQLNLLIVGGTVVKNGKFGKIPLSPSLRFTHTDNPLV